MARRSLRTIAAIAGIALLAAAPAQQHGDFALFGGKASVVSVLTRVGANEVDVAQYRPGTQTPLLRYAPSYGGETMHFILVRDDFQTFFHAHPEMMRDGHFRTHIALQPGHRFYAFASSTPFELRQQVFRFVLQAGAPAHQLTTLSTQNAGVTAGPYRVRLSRVMLPSDHPAVLNVRISGSNTGNAPLEMTIIGASNLEYLHPSEGPGDTFALPALPAGLYRVWVQLRRGATTYTAPFTIASR